METTFEISLNLKTAKGLETYGSFFLGSKVSFAWYVFNQLLGEIEKSENSVITLDLTKKENDIAYPISILHCNWEHLAYNIKLITKEIFKELNLEENN